MGHTMPTAPSSPADFVPQQSDWQHIGTLQGIYLRTAQEPAPHPVTSAQAVAHFGLAGDQHGSAVSPRQVLLAGNPAYEHWQLPANALRENLLLNFSTEQLASGDLLRIGNDVVLWLTFVCEPCSKLERRCPGTRKTLEASRGMLARVLRSGVMNQGDAIAISRAQAPAFSNDWRARVLQVARAVPEGHAISYSQLAEMAGVAKAYCRAFPRVLANLPVNVASRLGSAAKQSEAPVWSGAEFFSIPKDSETLYQNTAPPLH